MRCSSGRSCWNQQLFFSRQRMKVLSDVSEGRGGLAGETCATRAEMHAEVACIGKGPVCSRVASEHTNPDSGHATGSISLETRRPYVPTQRQRPAELCIGLQTPALPLGCSTLSESSAGSFGDALGWRHCQPQPCSAGHRVGKAHVGAASRVWWQPTSVLRRAGQPSKPCSRLAH